VNKASASNYIALSILPLLTGIAFTASLGLGDSKPSFTAPPISEQASSGRHIAGEKTGYQTWGLKMTEASNAWRVSRGSRKITVAVIDTGIDSGHPDLNDNLWVNEGESGLDQNGNEKASNGIDDDGNGYIDDVHGWNFVFNNSNLEDNHGHGTHIAGIIGASGRSRLMGVAPDVSLMVLKYFDPKKINQDPLSATVEAIHYAIEMGADVINYSGGGVTPNAKEREAIELAASKGILFVAAAGNERSNSDIHAYYPADYGLPNILSITAIDDHSRVLKTSNYGERTVHLAAPGENILSTLPGGKYGELTGTSQATAFATGVAVLLMAARQELRDPASLIEHLMRTGEQESQLAGKVKSRAILNAYRALAIIGENVTASGVEAANLDQIAASDFTISNGH
jgi:thermitase